MPSSGIRANRSRSTSAARGISLLPENRIPFTIGRRFNVDRPSSACTLEWPGCARTIACAVIVLGSAALTSVDTLAQAQGPQLTANELKKLTVEELMNVPVTSVSRVEESLLLAPAAIAVVTNEDIRRSGATNVPEALRLVPGIDVARQSSSQWAVSSRGFSSVNSEKLLVLSDTRSIYTPLFSGVLWDVQDYLLQDIDRIEVIRGPGATLWGSNAVNGVLNITTKSAKDTQGTYAEVSAGSDERFSAAARYGRKIGEGTYYRLFGKYADRDGTFTTLRTGPDDWQFGHIGFRADSERGNGTTLTIQGDAYQGKVGELAPSVMISGRTGATGRLRVDVAGGNALARWRHLTAGGSEVQLRTYYDRTHRDDPSFVDDLDTFDADFQHRFALRSRQDLTWGMNYRVTSNRNHGKGLFALDPESSTDVLVSGFVQNQIRLRDSLRLTVGTKIEHNDFSGTELQPSGRILWEGASTQTVWASVSRAVRVPTRLERDIAIDVNQVLRLAGNKDFESEHLVAYEVGYRWRVVSSLFLDVAAFHNRYHDLASLEVGTPFTDPNTRRTVIPIENRNLTDGNATGVESQVTFSPVRAWRLTATDSVLHLDLTARGQDLNRGRFFDGATPRNQLGLRSLFDLPAAFQFDASFRHLTALRRIPSIVTGEGIPGYAELDLRVAWRRWKQTELSIIGQNLLHDHHPEYGASDARGEIQRGVYAKVSWGF